MQVPEWLEGYGMAITVCDARGTILHLNRAAAAGFAASGGKDLVGQSLFDCHPEHARAELARLLATHEPNCYTVEKKGQRKLISQAPWWHEDDRFGGLVEVSIPLPEVLPHFLRDPS
jgi:transcriptional regulator with PAS, ATPase and Fis domain